MLRLEPIAGLEEIINISKFNYEPCINDYLLDTGHSVLNNGVSHDLCLHRINLNKCDK